jgi:hypothetical protein
VQKGPFEPLVGEEHEGEESCNRPREQQGGEKVLRPSEPSAASQKSIETGEEQTHAEGGERKLGKPRVQRGLPPNGQFAVISARQPRNHHK